jgi:hypothetical protein
VCRVPLCAENLVRFDPMTESLNFGRDDRTDIPRFEDLGASLFKPKSRLEAENAALRHQLMAPQRKVHGRV